MGGFDLHNLKTGKHIRSFKAGPATTQEPRQVAFTEGNSMVVGGSDHGKVYVFERKSSMLLQVLQHADDGQVRTIAVRSFSQPPPCSDALQTHERETGNMIAMASSDRSAGICISVWVQQEKSIEAQEIRGPTPMRLVTARSFGQLMLLMATLAFLYQNFWEVC